MVDVAEILAADDELQLQLRFPGIMSSSFGIYLS
jgi:hypothetical protein